MATTYTLTNTFADRVSNASNTINYDIDDFIDYDDTESVWELSRLMTRKENGERVKSPFFYTWEGEYQTRSVTFAEAVTTSEADADLSSANGVRVGDVIHVFSADAQPKVVRVSAIATNTITVSHLTAGPIANAATGFIAHEAAAENASSSVAATYVYPNRVTGYVTIMRRSFEWTITDDETRLYTGPSTQDRQKQARVELKKDLAHMCWFAVADNTTVTGVYISKGIIPQLQANSSGLRINAGADVISYSDITDLIDGLIEFADTKEYMLYCGTKAITGIAKMAAGNGFYRTSSGDGAFGFKGQTFTVGDFSLNCSFERVFKEAGTVTNAMAVALSPKNIKLAYLGAKGPFMFQPMIQSDSGGEVRKSQFRIQGGIKMQNNKRHGYIFNLG